MCTEEIPRQERAAESYFKQSVSLDTKIMSAWTKWDECRKKLHLLFNDAVADCPELIDFVEKIQMENEMRHLKARDELRYKLLAIENEEIMAFTEYMSDMPSMLKKLYLTLKGYDKAPPALTTEYLDIMKKAKSAKGITWSDKDSESDAHFKFVSTLDLDKPTTTLEYSDIKKENINSTVEITDSDDLTDIENKPLTKKRKGTPIKMVNNETIIINDSLESLDTTRNLNSAKKVKFDNPELDVENFIDPKDLNSTFVLNGKMEAWKKMPIKTELKQEVPVKKGLVDRTNIIPRTVTFNDNKGVYLSIFVSLPNSLGVIFKLHLCI